tara:strand:+ start:632 stop:955 length:324 start_codon:yes stop_codon:yes gene_type:complete
MNGSAMEIDAFLMTVERIGLPAVIIAACMFFIWKSQIAHREEIQEWNQKDSVADERLISLIKEQNRQSELMAAALNNLTVAYKDIAKTNERLAMEIKGMAEAIIRSR